MKFSESWLRTLVDPQLNQLLDALAALGGDHRPHLDARF